MSVPLAWDKMQIAFGYSLFERNDKEISRKPFVELRTNWPATNRRYSVNSASAKRSIEIMIIYPAIFGSWVLGKNKTRQCAFQSWPQLFDP